MHISSLYIETAEKWSSCCRVVIDDYFLAGGLYCVVHALVRACKISRCVQVEPVAVILVDVGESSFHNHVHRYNGQDGKVDELDAVLGRLEPHFWIVYANLIKKNLKTQGFMI